MTDIQAFILGIVQGLTEFFPVSSSTHLSFAKRLMGIES
ncbi:MAG: undecaprenyl-diphosphate phosphatase, partial [Smithella sp.]